MVKVYADPAEMPQGFHKAHCELCQRNTWHYKQGNTVNCSDHSAWTKPVPNRKIEGNIVMGTMGKSKPEPMTETAMRIANRLDRSLWSHAEERSKVSVVIGDEAWAKGLFEDNPVKLDPDKLYCTFCGDEIDRIHVTSERKPVIRKIIDAYKDESGEIHQIEKVISRVETIHACPNCCLKVRRPITVRRV
jgi:hypothetical protein